MAEYYLSPQPGEVVSINRHHHYMVSVSGGLMGFNDDPHPDQQPHPKYPLKQGASNMACLDPKQDAVNIMVVENGYAVTTHRDGETPGNGHYVNRRAMVFESFDSMVDYLRSQLPIFPVERSDRSSSSSPTPSTKRR